MPIGLLQYRAERNLAEVVIIISVRQRQGIGRTLLQAFRSHGEQMGWQRIWLITTNNNRVGQAFYEAVGMQKCAVYPNAVLAARKLKPELPEYDAAGVPIRDEIEYEWLLQGA
jgi:RimJ/RimL family protein N-acetyltransferase